MPILAGEILTADKLMRLQPKTYDAVGTTTQTGPLTDADVTGATVTFNTTAANATAVVQTVFDIDYTAATTTLGSGRLNVDGVGESEYAIFRQGSATGGRGTVAQTYRVTLASAGSHTLKLTHTVPTNCRLQGVYTTLTATVYEVV
ncbi:hypothetical protein OG596_26280 [Streptomyces sp. NBC_01102]|uniref:hypothetical protein n=1 Tax=Streptomyces sp. NBC_01102 TaxID=2903749 RepID=UPI00386357F7|nr:hypothetical protein OG596_26280 [Streptomyces sp. NBC_01102]